jgi:succinate-semialdehyde dehydrogenase/glutarate-semialdehyde dehydrogenase
VPRSVDPATGQTIADYAEHTPAQVNEVLDGATTAQQRWTEQPFVERSRILRGVADALTARREELAQLMAAEMGKPITQGRAEVDKCALVCRYYADEGPAHLADEVIATEHADARVVFRPLGTVLAVMPWNFPLWQVFRCVAPTVMAGNAVILKHASNVSGCALAIESLLEQGGAPAGLFRTLLIDSSRIGDLITDARISAVTLTGSEGAGRSVGEVAGRSIKKCVLELGGSDAYVVLADADIALAAAACASSRLINAGQSCIAAKRFIVATEIYDEFRAAFRSELAKRRIGAPLDEQTDVGPLARHDLCDDLADQVARSVDRGASVVLGGQRPKGSGAYFNVTLLDEVEPGMAAFDEELFGPVAALIRAGDENHAVELANNSTFGLGGAVFTRDVARGQKLAAERIESGTCVVNGMVVSDPRLPFGGVRASGIGRELGRFGIREFVNIKTVVVS